LRVHALWRRGRGARLAAALRPLAGRAGGPRRRGESRRAGPGNRRVLVRALLSVSDKRGIVEFARALAALGWEIVSTGGTAAAKNHQDVIVVADPDDYPAVIAALKAGELSPGASPGVRRKLAAKVFAHTAAYDAAIHAYLAKDGAAWPEQLTLALERRQTLRYGENPHQAAALYA